ncbi:hypothetical protein JCM33374_g1494 [Metschnikowia sp. JCM 33374]|nr:hypothetical protein JCM33374_g1494 [Metschnikowia sp. JCM 33374]
MSEPSPAASIPPVSPQNPPDSLAPTDRTESPSNTEVNPASATAGGRVISKNVLYVGGLDKSVSEETLQELMGANGAISSIKLLNDKNRPGFNYAFIEFSTDEQANSTLEAFNGRPINDSVLRINFAYQSSTFATSQNTEEQLYNIFVGDLSPEVDDEALYKFFSHFQSLKQAHVMWDMQTSRSRGYGFATFRDAMDAELALQSMNGKSLLGRAIRCNWASHKQSAGVRQNGHSGRSQNQRPYRQQYPRFPNGASPNLHGGQGFPVESAPYPLPIPLPGQEPQPQNFMPGPGPSMTPQPYDIILRQSPTWQTTVYLGNVAHFTQQNDLIPILQNFGYIVDFKFHPEKGCAFVKYDSHERAASAIAQLAGFNVNGRPLKCGWGKARAPVNAPYPNFNRNSPPMYDGRQ